MDSQRFDDFARALASRASRRQLFKGIAGGASGGLLGVLGVGRVGTTVSVAGAATTLKISVRPKVSSDGLQAIITWSTNQPSDTKLRYGQTRRLDQEVVSQEAATDHRVVLTDLKPGERYYYQASSSDASGTVTSSRSSFNAPECSSKKVACGGVCIAACPLEYTLDTATCQCACPAGSIPCGDRCVDVTADPENCGDCGITCAFDNAVAACASATCVVDRCHDDFADCDGDPSNGCETALRTADNCTACGDRCDDGNACTENTCDPSKGCVTENLEDGTACGSGGTCQQGTCVECSPGGDCDVDRDCCDDELCCGGSCVARSVFTDDPQNCGACGNACGEGMTCQDGECSCLDGKIACDEVCVDATTDPANCGTCGNVCAASVCEVATCAAGSCETAPAKDGTACDDGNVCTENDHCMDGACMGTAVADETACGDGKICVEGTCEDAPICTAKGDVCAAGGDTTTSENAATDSPCCDDLSCCDGTCVDFTSDVMHCGGCGIDCAGGECVDGACSGGDTDPGFSTAAVTDPRTILASYNFRSSGSTPYHLTAYRPRQFAKGATISDPTRGSQKIDDPGPYEGWDVLPTINEGARRVSTWSDWLQLRLNRAAVLAIVWRGGATRPTWLNAWTKGTDVVVNGKSLPTFRKPFSGGSVALGGVYNPDEILVGGRDTYWVLFAEADGQRSAPPSVPAGRTLPQPNQTCPAWVHDQYVTTGPDGRTYSTWHNQIDPIYWCYFRHEHGSDPAQFSPTYQNALGYVAALHGMTEPHAGFKNITFVSNSARWFISIHMGTASLGRVCTRFHTVDVAVRDVGSGVLLADLHLMADFGKSVVNKGDAPLTPPDCYFQALLAAGSLGIRKLPTVETGSIGYEPWRPDFAKTVVGLSGSLLINNIDPMLICNTATCDQGVTTGDSGSLRYVDANGFTIAAGTKNSGVFYTDPLGTTFVEPGAAGAVRQYIKPGLKLVLQHGDKCRDIDAWGRPFICNSGATSYPTNREGSLQSPN